MGVAGMAAASAELIDLFAPGVTWLVIALSLFAIVVGGLRTYWKGFIALRNRSLNMNALMSVAVTGALVIGEWPEAAMVMVLFALAEAIESLSLDRARNAIRKLMAMAPETATVKGDDGRWAEALAKEVAVGALVRVGPGERIPLDGELHRWQLSGEPGADHRRVLPVEKGLGDQVFAGTINGDRLVRVPRHQKRRRLDAGAHHPRCRGGAGRPRPDAALRRPLRAHLHAGRVRPRDRRRRAPAARLRRALARLGLPGARAARHRLPLRARHLHAGDGGQRACLGRPATAS